MYLLGSYNPDVMFVLYFDLLDALVSCQPFKNSIQHIIVSRSINFQLKYLFLLVKIGASL